MSAKIDPMHQFKVEPLVPLHAGGYDISFTNSAAWMLAGLAVIALFMWGGLRREVVPGRWQLAVEGFTGFIDNMVSVNIGPEGKKFAPYVFSLFAFILASNMLGLLPLGIVPGWEPFTPTTHFSITGVLAVTSFSIVLIVGFWLHGLKLFTLFMPPGVHWIGKILLFPIEFVSFMVRPFSLGLRLFVAMTAGHILMAVFGSFAVLGMNAFSAAPVSGGGVLGLAVGALSFFFVLGVAALELLVCAIQAYVFALLTTLYLNDVIHLH